MIPSLHFQRVAEREFLCLKQPQVILMVVLQNESQRLKDAGFRYGLIDCYSCHLVRLRSGIIQFKYLRLAAGRFYFKGFAVSAFRNGRMSFVSTYHNAFQRAVISGVAVIFTLLNSTADSFVCFTIIHFVWPPLIDCY